MENRTGNDFFATTRWTMIAAARDGDSPAADEALQALCASYWFPLYAYVRRRGYSKEDAEDLTQDFLVRVMDRTGLAVVESGKGKFRAFLLAALKYFLANEKDRTGRLKRGGGATHLPLDWHEADGRFQLADASHPTPDRAFDREWAVTLLERVVEGLRREFVEEGRGERFEALKGFLAAGKGEVPYAEAAPGLGMDEGALRVAVHRLRKRYRALLRQEVARTLDDPAMVDEEIRALMEAFG